MEYINESIILPCPTDELLAKKEKDWGVLLPQSYKEFIKKMNGVKVTNAIIEYDGHKEGIFQFFCIMPNVEDSWQEIDVIAAPIIERLVYSEERIGMDIIPIAKLAYGNYLVLDYKDINKEPQVGVWDFDIADYCNPSIHFVSESFDDFINSI